MRGSQGRLGLRGKLFIVFAALAVALVAVVLVAVHATRSTTAGADGVEVEFSERVLTDRAIVAAVDDLRRVEARLDSSSRANDGAVADSGRRLAAAIERSVDGGNGVQPSERQKVARLGRAYRQYLIVRRQIATAATPAAGRRAIERAFAPLEDALSAYAATHYAEAQEGLDALGRSTRGRTDALIAAIIVSLVSLVAVSIVLSGFARRVREYVTFTRRVANGDLDARVTPHGGDELAVLAAGLNAMAAELQQTGRDETQRAAREHHYRETQREFRDRLQVAGREREAHEVLRAHLQREIPQSTVVVLTREGERDRLEAGTGSCLSMRLAKTHVQGEGRPPLTACEACGKLAPETTCTPLLVGGEVIGSVLVGTPQTLEPDDDRRVVDSVAQAAPVLANLRNLALAEARAATDALTGLPNRRALHDSLLRMLAHAGRTVSPLSVIAFDLDHFKAINDTYGHDRGDAVLAAVGDMLGRSVRDSDLAARSGGEEFVVLLPDTPADGALAVAEKLRSSLRAIPGLDLERTLSASFGVATYPDHAAEGRGLLRLADRALYAAKAGGRDRVEISTEPSRTAPIGQQAVNA